MCTWRACPSGWSAPPQVGEGLRLCTQHGRLRCIGDCCSSAGLMVVAAAESDADTAVAHDTVPAVQRCMR